MIASAQFAATVRAFPDASPVSPEGIGVSTHPTFRTVLHQYHSSYESNSEEDETQSGGQQNPRNSSPAQTAPSPLRSTQGTESTGSTVSSSSSNNVQSGGAGSQDKTTATQDATPATDLRVARALHFVRQNRAIGSDASGRGMQNGKTSDPAVTLVAPVQAVPIVEPPRVILPLTATLTWRQEGTGLQNSSAVPQSTAPAADQDPQPLTPPVLELTEQTATTLPAGSLAFAARLSPDVGTPTQTPDPTGTTTSDSRLQTSFHTAAQNGAKQVSAGPDLSSDTRGNQGGESGEAFSREKAGDLSAKPEAMSAITQVAPLDRTSAPQSSSATNSNVPTTQPSSLARLEKIIDPPAAPPTSNHDITVRIPDSTDQGTAVRFVERGGEVHVSVRTGDAEMAQTLRGGLADLANRLEGGGIRAEIWQPGSDASYSQNDSHQTFTNPDGSNGRQNSSGSNAEQESNPQNKPRWVEELEGSIGDSNLKESQLLWQA